MAVRLLDNRVLLQWEKNIENTKYDAMQQVYLA